jgi:hypothetical protein
VSIRKRSETMNIRDPDGKRMWNILTCTLGVAT